MTDAEALARLLAWIGRDEGRAVTMMVGSVSGVWLILSYPVTTSGDSSQMGNGSGFARAVTDALARGPE